MSHVSAYLYMQRLKAEARLHKACRRWVLNVYRAFFNIKNNKNMKKNMEMSEYYIGRTDAYYNEEQDWRYTPALFVVTKNPKKYISAQSEIYQLTEKGADFFDDWSEKISAGYDLCYGRSKTNLRPEEVYNILTEDREYSVLIK